MLKGRDNLEELGVISRKESAAHSTKAFKHLKR
jgi:hypothetical protein